MAVSGLRYKQGPEGEQKDMAAASLMYRAVEFMILTGNTVVDEEWRPARIDVVKTFTEISRTVIGAPLLEGEELTINDCTLGEHNEYVKLILLDPGEGEKKEPTRAVMHLMGNSMRMIGNSIVTGLDDGSVNKSRTRHINVMNVPTKLQEYQNDHTERRPKHTAIPEVRTYDVAERANEAFNGAPPGLKTVQNKVYLKTGSGRVAAAIDKEASLLTINDLVKNQDVKVSQDPQAIVKVLGHGWTKAYLMEVG